MCRWRLWDEEKDFVPEGELIGRYGPLVGGADFGGGVSAFFGYGADVLRFLKPVGDAGVTQAIGRPWEPGGAGVVRYVKLGWGGADAGGAWKFFEDAWQDGGN